MAISSVTRRTPGVYVTELSAFPPSVVGVETAVPAFIGYTQKAAIRGKPVFLKPIRISSMADFEEIFGGAFKPLYDLKDVTPAPASAAGSSAPSAPDAYDFKVLSHATSPPSLKFYSLTDSTEVVSPPAAAFDFAFEREFSEHDAEDDHSTATQPFTDARFNLFNSMRLFYANGGGNCYVVSVGAYHENQKIDPDQLKAGLKAVRDQIGPTMLVMPDLALLPPDKPETPWVAPQAYGDVMQEMLKQCSDRQDRVAILDVYGGSDVIDDASMREAIDRFRTLVGEKYLNYGMAYFPALYTSVVTPNEIDYQNISTDSFEEFRNVLISEAENLYPADPARKNAVIANVKAMQPASATPPASPHEVLKLNQNLVATLPLLGDIETVMLGKNNVLPPSGAMAGVFTYTDSSRGVWNAPANISLTSVIQPTYKLTGDQQADLNVPVDGKAVDALREFTGRGTVVWGARTLDGNSNDYRYIQVRRTLIYIEQSIKNALNPFVFAANDGNTWSSVVAMCSAFLQRLWSQGGLMGATAQEAFSVQCGLGSTMTAQDILEGYMRVQVVLQMIRPAEFIELTFTQKMEGIA
jgi:hypothetical protein